MYVAAIGAPPPALRSAAMLAVAMLSRSLDRPVSPWAVLALGALIPLYDPHTVTDIGWQLSVAGFAALTAAGIWTRRHLPHDIRGWRRALARDLAVSILATVVTAPLVVWTFGRLSLVAPLTNIAASPVIALLQPTLFLALAAGPVHGVAQFVALAAHPLLVAFDWIATVGAARALRFAQRRADPRRCVRVRRGGDCAGGGRREPEPRCRPRAARVRRVARRSRSGGSRRRPAAARRAAHDRRGAGRRGRGAHAARQLAARRCRPHLDRRRRRTVHSGAVPAALRRRSRAVRALASARGSCRRRGVHPPRAPARRVPRCGVRRRQRVVSQVARRGPRARRAVVARARRRFALDRRRERSLSRARFGVDGGSRDPNAASTVALVQYGEVRFLLTGDAEAPEESGCWRTPAT